MLRRVLLTLNRQKDAYIEKVKGIRTAMTDLKVAVLLCQTFQDTHEFAFIGTKTAKSYERMKWSPTLQQFRKWATEYGPCSKEDSLAVLINGIEENAQNLFGFMEEQAGEVSEALSQSLIRLIAERYKLCDAASSKALAVKDSTARRRAETLLQDMARRASIDDLTPALASLSLSERAEME